LENTRELFQIFVRRFGILHADCCDCCCGEEVSMVQCHIMYEINRLYSPSMQQVAGALGMDITTFSRQIKTLEKKGLVEKAPDLEDRRINVLALTDKGKQTEQRIDLMMKGYIEDIMSQLTEFERDMIIRSMQLLNKAILQSDCCCRSK